MTPYEIPLSPEPQTFVISLADKSYRLSTSWCGAYGCWILDLAEPDGAPIVAGIPLVTGANLLSQYEHLGFGGKIFVQSSGDPKAVPGFADLGVSGIVFFVTDP